MITALTVYAVAATWAAFRLAWLLRAAQARHDDLLLKLAHWQAEAERLGMLYDMARD